MKRCTCNDCLLERVFVWISWAWDKIIKLGHSPMHFSMCLVRPWFTCPKFSIPNVEMWKCWISHPYKPRRMLRLTQRFPIFTSQACLSIRPSWLLEDLNAKQNTLKSCLWRNVSQRLYKSSQTEFKSINIATVWNHVLANCVFTVCLPTRSLAWLYQEQAKTGVQRSARSKRCIFW